jgi:hypothetical protein
MRVCRPSNQTHGNAFAARVAECGSREQYSRVVTLADADDAFWLGAARSNWTDPPEGASLERYPTLYRILYTTI